MASGEDGKKGLIEEIAWHCVEAVENGENRDEFLQGLVDGVRRQIDQTVDRPRDTGLYTMKNCEDEGHRSVWRCTIPTNVRGRNVGLELKFALESDGFQLAHRINTNNSSRREPFLVKRNIRMVFSDTTGQKLGEQEFEIHPDANDSDGYHEWEYTVLVEKFLGLEDDQYKSLQVQVKFLDSWMAVDTSPASS